MLRAEEIVLTKIGKRIILLRMLRNMTQSEFAYKTGMNKAALSRIEKGKANMTVRTLYRISNALDVTLSELVIDCL